MEFSDFDEEDIETVLHSHNFYRVIIANGKESRGNPGPQPAARTMMELVEKSTEHAQYLIIYPGGGGGGIWSVICFDRSGTTNSPL